MWLLAGVSRHYTENDFTDASQRTTPQTWPWNTILWYSGLQLLGVRPQDFLVDRVSIDLCVGCLPHALHSHPSSIHLYQCGCHGWRLFSQAGKCHLMPSPSCLSVHVSSPVPLVVFCAYNLCSYTRPPSTSAVLVQRSSSNQPVTVLCKWAPPLLLPPSPVI